MSLMRVLLLVAGLLPVADVSASMQATDTGRIAEQPAGATGAAPTLDELTGRDTRWMPAELIDEKLAAGAECPDGRCPLTPVGEILLDLVPHMAPGVKTWFAVVVILLLTLRLRPLGSVRNLDGVILATTCVLLFWRSQAAAPVLSWIHLGLAVVAVYWLFRGLVLLVINSVPRRPVNLAGSAFVVLMIAGVFVAADDLLRTPVSVASRDGIVGGAHLARTGKLPHGVVPGAGSQSPLLYLVHGGAIRAIEFVSLSGRSILDVDPDQLADGFLDENENVGRWVALTVNGTLLVALLVAVWLIGARAHSSGAGAGLVALLCVFPGAGECFGQPEIMLPAVLVAWSLAFALLSGLGGLLAMVCIVLAGVAWPWAWLLAAVMLAYLLRRGWQALGAVVGTTVGAAACVAGVIALVSPALPRVDGSIGAAGLTPAHKVQLTADGGMLFEHTEAAGDTAEGGFAPKRLLWRFLLNRDGTSLG